ncbi:hypothetical protein ACHAP4_011293 [Fusarium culmorum]
MGQRNEYECHESFSTTYKEVGKKLGYYLVPSASNIIEYAQACTKNEYKGVVVEEKETGVYWSQLQKASLEEAEIFTEEYRRNRGPFKFNKKEVRKAYAPDIDFWQGWMNEIVEASFVSCRQDASALAADKAKY